MKKTNIKPQFLTSFVLIILVATAFVQITDNSNTVRPASVNQALKASSIALPSEKLDLVAFSSDGKTLANVESDGRIKLWDVATGQARVTLPGQFAGLVNGIAFSPDGKTLASVRDNSIRLWDVASGTARLIIPVSALVTDLVFSPDGKTLAAVDQDARVTLLDSRSGSANEILTDQQSGVNAIAFSPDSTILATGGEDAQIKLWDRATGQEQASLSVEGGAAVTALAFSPNGKTLAAVGLDARITLRDSQSGSIVEVLTGHQNGVNAIAFSPDSKILATSGQDAQIKLWDRATGREQASLPGEGGVAITDLVFSPNGKTLASVGESETVYLWDVSNKRPQLLMGHRDWVDKVAFNSNQKTLASMGKTGQVVVWNLVNGLEQQTFQIPTLLNASLAGSQAPVSGNAVSNTSSQLKTSNTSSVASSASIAGGSSQAANKDTIIKVNKRSAQKWKGIRAFAISEDGSEMGVAGDDGEIRILKKNGSQRWKVSGHHGNAIAGLAYRGKTKEWVSAGRDTEIKTWDDSTGKNLHTFYGPEHPPRAVVVSPDGQFIATAGEDTRVFLYDALAKKLSQIFSGHIDFVNGLAFSPDGKVLASAGAEGRTLLWDVKTGKHIRSLLGHSGAVNAVAFSRDGTLIASASADSTIILWSSTTGEQFKKLSGHQGSIRSLAFSPNGKELISAGEDTRMLVWDSKTGQIKKQIGGQASAVNIVVFDPAGNLHTANENSEVSEINTGTGIKINTIVVPAKPAVSPQASRSESLSVATTLALNDFRSSPVIEKSKLGKENQRNSIIGSVFNQLLDWVIPPANADLPPPPGGPILVIRSGITGTPAAPDFGNYYAEILRTEGLNEFAVEDISNVNAGTLSGYDVVILAQMSLTQAQADMLSAWVTSGGNLIAMRPDKKLASLLGLIDASSILDNGYLLIDTSVSPGNGIVGQTMQFHGTADRYTLSDATSIATLYNTASTATPNPAVTLKTVGTGQAAGFTFDLAKSISYTRQGNPAWATQDRDITIPNMVPLIRSDDKFYGDGPGDPQPDWIDFTKISIPQGDEQQRLLVNLILEMNRDKKPLPRFWYFPSGFRAAVIMTGDDHANNGTEGRFNSFITASPAGCIWQNWECVRGTSYMYHDTPIAPTTAVNFNAQGFEVGLHINTNCDNFTPASLEAFYVNQINLFQASFPGLPAPITQRHHCIAWSDWVTGAKVQLSHGIRLDTSYYFWPPSWVLNRPGFFSGSGMPMRFADLDGTLIDVYNVTSQMTDESGQSYPFTINSLLDKAVGPEGYYGAYTINAHTDVATITESTTVVASAQARGVPIVTSRQMMDWLDHRNSSSFGGMAWSGNTLSFTVTQGTGSQNVPANGLQVLLPVKSSAGLLANLTLNGGPVPFTNQTIKGVDYTAFSGLAGAYVATYAADTTAPTVTLKTPADGATGVSLGTTVTATFSEAMDATTLTAATLELRGPAPQSALVSATVSYNAATRAVTLSPSSSLVGSTTYTATVKGGATDPRVKDLAGNALAANVTWSFTTEAQPCASASCSAWSDSTIPSTPSVNDPSSAELGVKFRADISGFVTGIRFYKGSTNTGTHVGSLWTETGEQLATATFANETASGWQQVTFGAPVAITANTVYVASYHAPNGNYAATNSPEFASSGVDNPPIHLLRDGVSGGNGVYAYSGGSTFPASTYNATNYWVDVVFTTTAPPDTTPPAVTAQSPVAAATGVATNTAVTAIFSEAMDAATITASTFELRGPAPGNPLIPATVSYNASTRTATLTPDAALSNSTDYTATVKGGTTDPRVKDAAGNALAADFTWTFTTAAAGGATGCSGSTNSIWAADTTPAVLADSDTASVELGVKFRSTQNGYICGIRFYKGSTNTGTHIGKLWSSSGALLASANFQNETASGWQQVNFASPVQIVANQQYVASYLAPVGRYSANSNYFAAGVTSGPLYAFSSAESGGNGVYQYGAGGFPTNSYQASNYWVDVVFTTSIGPDTTPPTVSSTSPASNVTGVVPANPVTVTFSEAMDAATINDTTFELRNPANVKVGATVSYSAASNTATLTPSSALAESRLYTAKVIGGTSGVKDAAAVPNPLAADYTWTFTTGVDPCSTGGNPIVCENSKTGNPSSEWDISGTGDSSIQGYATDISVNRGQTVRFKINTISTNYRLDIYRLGYYNGDGARKVATIEPSATLPQNQSACLNHAATGLIDCGNWVESASWAVPADAVSGIYFAKVIREDGTNTGASHIVFIVRDDASTSDVLFQTADTTWQAYNDYGGNSLYTGSPAGRAYKVSYNRPFNTRSVDNGQDWLFNSEYPMVRWLEANGYNVSYFTGVDADRFGNLIKNHKIFLSVGHDEYWSRQQRENVEKARDNTLVNQVDPVNLGFFSGNEVFWKTRWENNITNANGNLGTDVYRTLVCYKETHAGAKIDPSSEWTGTWRDPRFSPPADGGRPENALTGTIFTVNDGATTSIQVPEADGKMRFWRNTTIANLTPGSSEILPNGTLGYEWDEDLDNGDRPGGLMRLSTTTVAGAPVLVDYGSTFGSGTAIHSLTMYRADSGALVFGAGTVQWPWGLDSTHDRSGSPTNASMQQATVNLFADMGVQPNTLQAGLVGATASSDTTRPTSTITSPIAGSTVTPGSAVAISGTASDVGGVVGGVEVSFDGGTTWHPTNGRSPWTYNWTAPNTNGQISIKSRAVDDSLNLESPGASITVTVGTGVDTEAPTAPGNLSASVTSGTQVSLSWTASTDNVAVAGYRVERCQGGGCSNFVEITTPTATSFADSGLTEGTAYRYRVRAADTVGNLGAYSTVVTVNPDATAPTTPTGLSATATSGTQISLTWTASTDNVAVTGYQVERCQGTGCSNFAQVATPMAASFSDTGLTAGTTYSYRVRAVDAVPLFSGYSNIAEATTQTQTVPIAVNDTFLYLANVLRTVNAPGPLGLGVLANDTHAGNLPLTAQLVAGSLSGGGTLNLASNGSFTYLRTTVSNTVSFRYRASAGSVLSEPATGATVNMRGDAAPTTVADNCIYDRSANTVTQPARCTVTETRVVQMNVVLNDTDANVTTNAPTDGVGKTVVSSTMVVTVAGTGVTVAANPACGQGALGTTAERATIVNNCNGTLTVTMTATNTQNIIYSYRVSDDLGAQSGARSNTLTSQS